MTTSNMLHHLFVSMVVVAIAAVSPVTAEDPQDSKRVDSLLINQGSLSESVQKESDALTSTLGLAPPAEAVVLFDGSNSMPGSRSRSR